MVTGLSLQTMMKGSSDFYELFVVRYVNVHTITIFNPQKNLELFEFKEVSDDQILIFCFNAVFQISTVKA